MNRHTILAMLALALLALPAAALAGAHAKAHAPKKGVLLVAFGTSVPEAQKVFAHIEAKVNTAYPGIPVRWAFTSGIIRHKLARQGQRLDSPEMALARMMDEGFTHVAVQSLHTIAGEEFHDLQRNAQAFAGMVGGFRRIRVGYPLLGSEADLKRVTDAMIDHIPAERRPADAVVLMGHGTPHPANAFYAAMAYHFQQKDPNIFVGTVEGSPTIEEIRQMLLVRGIGKAYLMPFMSVAGDHAMNDMAGEEPDSWKSILTGAGIQCVPVMKGTAEYDQIVQVWVDHLGRVLASLE